MPRFPETPLPALQRHLGQWFWIGVCVSTIAIMLAPLIGWINAAIFLGFWVTVGAMLPGETLRAVATGGPVLWAIPVMAFLSALWSGDPDFTLRSALQYALTVAAAMMMARQLRVGQFISMLMCAMLVVSVLSLLVGRYDIDPMTGISTFVGVFGSKNMLAFFSSIMMLAAVAVAVDPAQSRALRLAALVALLLSVPTIITTRSATAQITAVLAVAAFFSVMFFFRLAPLKRAVLGVIVLIFVGPVALLFVLGQGHAVMELFVSGVLGKSMTLTGRTTLWQYATGLMAEQPWVGYGWGGFWRRETVEAEGLWREFHVTSRSGFHFHSTYFETGVQLGYIGLALIVTLYLTNLLNALRWVAREPTPEAAFVFTALAVMFVRSFVEVDVLSPFSIGVILLMVSGVYARRSAARPYRRTAALAPARSMAQPA